MVLSETNYLNLNKNKKACIDDVIYAGQLKQYVRQTLCYAWNCLQTKI